MKQRKRYTSERAILAEIHEAQRDANAAFAEAEQLEAVAKEYIKDPERAGEGQYKLKEAQKLRDRGTRLIEVKAKKLGERLAEFRTEPMTLLNGDRSIQQ